MSKATADQIRDHVRTKYVEPARLNHQQRFSVRCGAVQKDLGMPNRIAYICAALKSPKFLDPNGLRLVETGVPPLGRSTTAVYTYEFRDPAANIGSKASATASIYAKLKQMEGVLKDVYRDIGGSNRTIQEEREGYSR